MVGKYPLVSTTYLARDSASRSADTGASERRYHFPRRHPDDDAAGACQQHSGLFYVNHTCCFAARFSSTH